MTAATATIATATATATATVQGATATDTPILDGALSVAFKNGLATFNIDNRFRQWDGEVYSAPPESIDLGLPAKDLREMGIRKGAALAVLRGALSVAAARHRNTPVHVAIRTAATRKLGGIANGAVGIVVVDGIGQGDFDTIVSLLLRFRGVGEVKQVSGSTTLVTALDKAAQVEGKLVNRAASLIAGAVKAGHSPSAIFTAGAEIALADTQTSLQRAQADLDRRMDAVQDLALELNVDVDAQTKRRTILRKRS